MRIVQLLEECSLFVLSIAFNLCDFYCSRQASYLLVFFFLLRQTTRPLCNLVSLFTADTSIECSVEQQPMYSKYTQTKRVQLLAVNILNYILLALRWDLNWGQLENQSAWFVKPITSNKRNERNERNERNGEHLPYHEIS